MNVNACEKIARSAGMGKASKTEASDDFFKVLLQMLAQCVLNAKDMPPQGVQAAAGDDLSGIEQGLQGASLSETSDQSASCGISGGMCAQPMVRYVGGGGSGFISSSVKGASDEGGGTKDTVDIEAAVDAKDVADIKGVVDAKDMKQQVLNSGETMRSDKAPQKLLNAVKTSLIDGNVSADVSDINALKEDAGKGVSSGKPAAVQETASPQRDFGFQTGETDSKLDAAADGSGNMHMYGPQKTVRAAERIGVSQTAIKDLTGDMKLTSLKFSGKKDEGIGGGGDGSDRKDDDISARSNAPVFQDNEVSKPFAAADGKAMQAGMEKQPARIDKDDILSQVYDRIKVFSEDGSSELHVNLKPDQLGEVSIKLVMEKGIINARVTVDNPEIKSIMQGSIPEIKEHLQKQDINISNLSVYVGTDRGESDGGGDSQRHEWRRSKKAQLHSSADVLAVQKAPYYGGVLNLLA